MKPQLLKISNSLTLSFSVRHDIVPHFFSKWHYHSEIELLHIKKGSGLQFVGDHISRFAEGDILLIGSNLPHYWRCDANYFEDDPDTNAEAIVTHFLPDFWGAHFLELHENKQIKGLLVRARTGIKVNGKTNLQVAALLEKLLTAENASRIIILQEALHFISISNDLEYLSTANFQADYNSSETERISNIYNYTIKNFDKKISLEQIANVAAISPKSFCRYFKSHTGKTYYQFLIELRIGNACKLLMNSKNSISIICYQSGFNNFSNFNRYFKSITGIRPLQYKKMYAK